MADFLNFDASSTTFTVYMPPKKGEKNKKTVNNALDELTATMTDSDSGKEASTAEPELPEQSQSLADNDPPPISKRKRGPGKNKGKILLKCLLRLIPLY